MQLLSNICLSGRPKVCSKKKIARVPPLQKWWFFKNFGHFLAKFEQKRILRWWNNGTRWFFRLLNVGKREPRPAQNFSKSGRPKVCSKKKIARVPPLQNGGFFKNFGHFLAKFGQNRILRWWNNGTLHVVRVSNVFSKNSAFSMLKEGNRVRFQMGQTSSAHSTLRRRFFFAFFC